MVREGEAAKELEKILRIVQIDPLWVNVPVPTGQARERLKVDQGAHVVFANEDDSVETLQGKIINIGSVADAASDTLNVRVEVSNPSRRPAGEHVTVIFPPLQEAETGQESSEIAARDPEKRN